MKYFCCCQEKQIDHHREMLNTRYVMRKDRGVKILAEKLSLVSYKAIFIIVFVVTPISCDWYFVYCISLFFNIYFLISLETLHFSTLRVIGSVNEKVIANCVKMYFEIALCQKSCIIIANGGSVKLL